MSKIRSKNTKLDLYMETILRNNGITFKKYPRMLGNPDFLIRKNLVIFCDSSFWHGKNWKTLKKKLAKGNNSEYWINHISKNRKRDGIVSRKLKRDGYTVVRVWDNQVYKRPDLCIAKIKKKLSSLR
jgi:DNA mismatch endonuclease (patch repair protein)